MSIRIFVFVALIAFVGSTSFAQSDRVRLVSGEARLYYNDEKHSKIVDDGEAFIDGVYFEVELRATVRSSDTALLEQSKLAGLEGICEIYADGDPVGRINMRSGRMEVNIWGGMLDAVLDSAFEGQPDNPDVDFSASSNKAEWIKRFVYDGRSYDVMVRFVHREASGVLKYYAFIDLS